jgi:hypothetical protein
MSYLGPIGSYKQNNNNKRAHIKQLQLNLLNKIIEDFD